MAVKRSVCGTFEGRPVEAYTLTNRNGLKAKVMSHGARLIEMQAPDRGGRFADVVLGFDDVASYAKSPLAMGGTCGRMVNRIRNARFRLDGKDHQLAANWHGHQLHGGAKGFEQRLWRAEAGGNQREVTFSYVSADGEEGYPGEVKARVTYVLDEDDSLTISMKTETNKTTVANLSHHSYWNLGGHDEGTIEDHFIAVEADSYTPLDRDLLPTGEIAPAAGTPFDLSAPRQFRDCFAELAQAGQPDGFDGNWCLRHKDGSLRRCAVVWHDGTGRKIEVSTTEPGLQIYTAGTFPERLKGKSGAIYGKFSGVALEPQLYPDAPNIPQFPSARLEPGELREQVMRIEFSTI